MTRGKILLAEDQSIIAADLATRLEDLGFEVTGIASTGEEAVRLAETVAPDLAILDIRLAGDSDGVVAGEEIRRRLGVPVVFLTAHSDPDTLARAKEIGPSGYLVKPVEDNDLRITLELALHKHEVERALESSRAEVAEHRAFLDALFDTVPVGVMVVDRDDRVVMFNRYLREAWGPQDAADRTMTPGELLGCPLARMTKGDCCNNGHHGGCFFRTAMEEAFAGKRVERKRGELLRMDGETPLHTQVMISAIPFDYQSRSMIIVILEDVTELAALRKILQARTSFAGIVGTTPEMLRVFETIREVADVAVPVMILGESGTGKELVARAIHESGARSGGPFISLNCGALPEGLLESELFGHVRGAFTGAVRDRRGRFELADGGTLFLDEVADLSPAMQVKLLRAIQEGSFERVGDERTRSVDVRVVCATNRDLEQMVADGSFRSDLFYRLFVVPIRLPRLAERLDDLPLLVENILERLSADSGGRRVSVDPKVLEVLAGHQWPGNIRELQNVLQYAWIKCRGETIAVEHLPPNLRSSHGLAAPRPPRRLTLEAVREALEQSGGNKTEAARLLGVSRATLYRHLARLGRAGVQGPDIQPFH